MYFNHSEHGQGLFPSNRIRYVTEALRKERMVVDFRQTALKGENAGHVRGIRFGIREWEGMLIRLIRLSRSVKDLDLMLKSERVNEIAIRAFDNGVTNMKSFLYALEDRFIHPKKDWQKHNLNAHEKKVLAKYHTEGKNLESEVKSHKKYIKKFLKFSSEVKKLNFEILEELTKLQNLLLHDRYRKAILKREVKVLFRDIADKTIEMAKVMDKLTFHPRYEKKAKEIIRHYGGIINDCSSWVLDENEADKIMGMTSDKGGVLDFESVKTVEELVRFMHAEMARIPTRGIYHDLFYKEEGLAFLELADFGLTNFICLNMDEKKAIENLEAYKILKKVVKDMPEELTEMRREEKAIAFMGHDYAEITLPMGKHFAEIKCEMDDQNRCYAVNVRYVDTMYRYAQSRKAYVEKVLTDLGFTIDENMKRTIMATLRTEDRKTWAEGYGELIRLMFSAKDLDLGCDPNESAEMFQRGFTWIRRCDPGYEIIMYSDDTEKVEKYREIIGSVFYDGSDKQAFTDLFMEQFDYRPSKIVPLVKDFELNELDGLFGFLIHLEVKAKEEGDKRKVGQIQRLWKKLEKVLAEKESKI